MTQRVYKKIMILITYAFFLLFLLLNFEKIGNGVWNLIQILKPLWYGLTLAFVLNVPMSIMENKLFKSSEKPYRILALILSVMILIIILIMLFTWVIPDFIESLTYLIGQIPVIVNDINNIVLNSISTTGLSEYVGSIGNSKDVSNLLSSFFKYIVENFYEGASNIAGLLINLITGFIIAIYFLLEKEFILGKCKTIIYKVFDDNMVNRIKYVYGVSNKAFRDFITYQCLECFILASIMFVTYLIFGFPYALTIAFLTGVTAIIPIFGATIACVIGAVLIGTVSMEKMIIFIIVFQIVQQIENNLIYPRVVGKNVGLPPILTLIAIIAGGSLFGLFGVLVSVPLTSVLNQLFWSLMEKDLPKFSLEKKKKTLKKLRKN